MKTVNFEYSLKYSVIISEKAINNFSILSASKLKGIAKGKLYIFFEPQQKYIILETGIIDYIEQFTNVINEIDSGNFTPFSVSCDWYSNSINYNYNPISDKLTLSDVNEGKFEVITKYKVFKKSFIKFKKSVLEDLSVCYPELKNNIDYTRIVDTL